MAKNYFYITFLLAFFFTVSVSAQDSKPTPKTQGTPIEGLNLYPNPVVNGKVYITSKNDLEKEIIIFDVLGKKVLQAHLTTKELNIGDLTPGVYIIKISEQGNSATRKLIVR
ncbi:T9SS type A sorting domain-containing protein [Flavobacterium limi]|uniref:T9SS C-terminal target domain-containing protein n=1 Tax=Flavobacterium limi TaxID=2045105 RepID=A0ABQ1UJQ5_9FLAO|nr:T9SS type A sorting domain-containing protein [Flavobacterium limi]GGF19015.1 T9SS C-terminal target domain-containing protein [Flavobacterium limi]